MRDFIGALQEMSAHPLFIASDVERGVGQQIAGTTVFPSQMALAAAVDRDRQDRVSLLRDTFRVIAAEAVDMGITMPFIPVLDVNSNADNPIICNRAFSDRPDVVSWFGAECIRVLEEAGLMSCAKHFPGHGDTAVDSHIDLPVITRSRDDLHRCDLLPFAEAIRAGVSSVMMGHLCVRAYDDMPATLSRTVVTGLLREELGFGGLILTDALNMAALKTFGNVAAASVNAGCDILLHPADADQTVDELVGSLKSGALSSECLAEAIGRVGKFRVKNRPPGDGMVSFDEHRRLAAVLSERSVTLVKAKEGMLPLRNADGIRLFRGGDDSVELHPLFRERFGVVSAVTDPVRERAGLSVVLIFATAAAWRGTSGIAGPELQVIRNIVARSDRSVVVSLGCPYVLRYFPEADALIAVYDSSAMTQEALFRCLTGEIPFAGRLPVRINGVQNNVTRR